MKKLHWFCYLFAFMSCSTSKFVVDKPSRTSSSSDSSISAAQTSLVKEATKLLGSPYKYGGTNPSGFDCSGFTWYVYSKALNMQLKRTSKDQARMGKNVHVENLQPGDLIFFKFSSGPKINHVSLVTENKRGRLIVIHSTTSRGVIKEDILGSPYWKPKIAFAKRII
ncbi:MAG: C40 family peptidase [Bacteroidia bacterium]|nr:C40 family peptidase [Bacteroidia bacterium]